ncbi:MAG: branched-chain amino acid ABC transporter permease [Antricoccus sp.]
MKGLLRLARSQAPTAAAAIVLVLYAQLNGDPAGLALGVNIVVAAIAAVGLTLVIGSAGQLALGQAGFMAIGAYGTAYLMLAKGWSFVPAVVVSVALALVVGIVVGYIALRLRGNYLAMATLAVGSGIYALLVIPSRLGGANGYSPIPLPTLFGHRFVSSLDQYFLVAGFLVLVLFGARFLLLSRVGRELIAMRDDEVAARTVGVNVTVRKVQIFAIASAIGGLAGAVTAPLQGAIDPTLFSTAVSLQLFVMVVVGGLGNIYGAVLGAALVTYLIQAVPGSGSWALTLLGAVVVAFMAFLPDGIVGLVRLGRRLVEPHSRRGARTGVDARP